LFASNQYKGDICGHVGEFLMSSGDLESEVKAKPHVGLFVTCLVDFYRPNVGFAAIALLEQSGCTVSVPESQTCCGQPAYNSGDQKSTLDIAIQTIEAFERFDYIVAPSGSCAGMLKTHYPEIFAGTALEKRALAFSEKVFELTSFLVDELAYEPVAELNAKPGANSSETNTFNESITYHDSCAGLRELNIKQQPRDLLAKVDGLKLIEMDDTEVCCGFGGTFCVKFPDISERMVTDKAALVQQSGAGVLAGGDMGCLLNISGRIKRVNADVRVYHVAEILAGMADGPGIGDA